jgi:LysR family transcriptional regulator, nitrogen assimilation regulatory protein
VQAIVSAYGPVSRVLGDILDLRHLRYFVNVIDMGSLSKAAGTLSISQPSLSQQIAAMEYELGVPLLLRSATGVRPTDAGAKLYRHARLVMRQMEELQADVVNEGSGAVGHVAVGLPTSIAAVLAVPLVERLAQDHPGVRLHLFESLSGYLVELLANGRLDMAVLFRDTETSGVAIRPLFVEHLSLFGAPAIGDPSQPVCDLRLLGGVPLVLPSRANGLRLLIERIFEQSNIELNVIADIDSLPVMLALARNGTAATINSVGVARASDLDVLTRRLVNPTVKRPVCLCLPTGIPQTAASLAAEETIRTLARESSAMWDKVDRR